MNGSTSGVWTGTLITTMAATAGVAMVVGLAGCDVFSHGFNLGAGNGEAIKVGGGGAQTASWAGEVIGRLGPTESEKIKDMPAQVAWDYLQGDRSGVDKVMAAIFGDKKIDRTAIEQDAATKMASSAIPSAAFDEMINQFSMQISTLMVDLAKGRTPHAGKLELVIATFHNYSKNSTEALDFALRNVERMLANNPQVTEKFHLTTYNVSDARDLLKAIGGGSDAWVNSDGSNFQEVMVRHGHPDDIYVLTGDMIERLDSQSHTLRYEVVCNLEHPRTRSAVAGSARNLDRTYVFHPHKERGWLSQRDEKALADAWAAKNPAVGTKAVQDGGG